MTAHQAEPPLSQLLQMAATAQHPVLWLTGGEPTLRSDLPALCQALSEGYPERELGIVTGGRVLSTLGAADRLREAGVSRVRLLLHSARLDAHDWLAGSPRAGRLALVASRRVIAAGMTLELQAVVTRPTAAYLTEWVALGARLGAEALHLQRLVSDRIAPHDHTMLAARIGLLQEDLEAAAALSLSSGIPLSLEGFPTCVAPRLAPLFRPAESVQWLGLEASDSESTAADLAVRRCDDCHGRPACPGAPADYVAKFGMGEFLSERSSSSVVAMEPVPPSPQDGGEVTRVPAPPVRGYRDPATRVGNIGAVLARARLGGDPIVDPSSRPVPTTIWATWGASRRQGCPHCETTPAEPMQSTRALRCALVEAAQRGASTLRIVGTGVLSDPLAKELLPDVARLSFPRVELAVDASPLSEWTDRQLARLKRITRVDGALYGPDAATHDAHAGAPGVFDAALEGLRRLKERARVEVGSYGVLHDGSLLAAYHEAWEQGRLPGEPHFRLSPAGGSLTDLARDAEALPHGPTRTAVEALLPSCLRGSPSTGAPGDPGDYFCRTEVATAAITGADRYGTFLPCACGTDAASTCVGRAEGWSMNP